MNRMILVPIDISDTELTDRVIKHVEAEARIDDAEVHFLTVIPSDLKAESESRLKEIVKKFTIPEDRVHLHVSEGSPKDKILAMAKSLPADLVIISSHRPDITTYLLGSNAAAVVRHAECSVLVVR